MNTQYRILICLWVAIISAIWVGSTSKRKYGIVKENVECSLCLYYKKVQKLVIQLIISALYKQKKTNKKKTLIWKEQRHK